MAFGMYSRALHLEHSSVLPQPEKSYSPGLELFLCGSAPQTLGYGDRMLELKQSSGQPVS